MIRSIKLGMRSALAFGLVMLLSLALGGNAILQMERMEDYNASLVNDMNGLVLAGRLNYDTSQLFNDMYRLRLAEPEQHAALLQAAERRYDQVRHNLDSLNSMMDSPASVASLQQVEASFNAFAQAFRQFIGYIRANNSSAITQLYQGSLDRTITQLQEAEQQFIHLLDEEGEQAAAALQLRSDRTQQILLIGLFAVLVLSALLAWLYTLSITKPMQQAVLLAETIAKSDLTLHLEVDGRDEPAAMLRALLKMQDNLKEALGNIAQSSTQLSAAAEELSSITQETESNTLRQNQEIDLVATAMTEMTSTVQEVAHSAESAALSARDANTSTLESAEVVRSTIDDVQSLTEEIKQAASVVENLGNDIENITTVLDVIRNIADQTNLLALNAAIEAARAGEHGRGFAVVADEVRTLAGRTQSSTEEIEKMIRSLQTLAHEAVTSMDSSRNKAENAQSEASNVSEALNIITHSIHKISEMNEQIASAAEEQSSVADEINHNIININEVSEQTVAASSQTSIASHQVAELASGLQDLVNRFKC